MAFGWANEFRLKLFSLKLSCNDNEILILTIYMEIVLVKNTNDS